MAGERGGNLFMSRLHDYLSDHASEQLRPKTGSTSVPVEVVVQYQVSSLLGLLTWWLDRDLPYPPEKMDAMFKELTPPGLEAVLRR